MGIGLFLFYQYLSKAHLDSKSSSRPTELNWELKLFNLCIFGWSEINWKSSILTSQFTLTRLLECQLCMISYKGCCLYYLRKNLRSQRVFPWKYLNYPLLFKLFVSRNRTSEIYNTTQIYWWSHTAFSLWNWRLGCVWWWRLVEGHFGSNRGERDSYNLP